MPLHGETLQTRQERGRKPGILRINKLLAQGAVGGRKIRQQRLLARAAFALPKKMLQCLPLRLMHLDKLLLLHAARIPRKNRPQARNNRTRSRPSQSGNFAASGASCGRGAPFVRSSPRV